MNEYWYQDNSRGQMDNFTIDAGEVFFFGSQRLLLRELQDNPKLGRNKSFIDEAKIGLRKDHSKVEESFLNLFEETGIYSSSSSGVGENQKRQDQNYVRQTTRKVLDSVEQKPHPTQPSYKFSRDENLLRKLNYLFFILRNVPLSLRKNVLIQAKQQLKKIQNVQRRKKCLRLVQALLDLENHDFVDESKIESTLFVMQRSTQDRKSKKRKYSLQGYLKFEEELLTSI